MCILCGAPSRSPFCLSIRRLKQFRVAEQTLRLQPLPCNSTLGVCDHLALSISLPPPLLFLLVSSPSSLSFSVDFVSLIFATAHLLHLMAPSPGIFKLRNDVGMLRDLLVLPHSFPPQWSSSTERSTPEAYKPRANRKGKGLIRQSSITRPALPSYCTIPAIVPPVFLQLGRHQSSTVLGGLQGIHKVWLSGK